MNVDRTPAIALAVAAVAGAKMISVVIAAIKATSTKAVDHFMGWSVDGDDRDLEGLAIEEDEELVLPAAGEVFGSLGGAKLFDGELEKLSGEVVSGQRNGFGIRHSRFTD